MQNLGFLDRSGRRCRRSGQSCKAEAVRLLCYWKHGHIEANARSGDLSVPIHIEAFTDSKTSKEADEEGYYEKESKNALTSRFT